MIRTKAKSFYDKALLDDDDEGDAEGETGQSLVSASSATSDSPPRGRGFNSVVPPLFTFRGAVWNALTAKNKGTL